MIINCNGGHAIFRQTIFLPWNWFKDVQGKNRQDPNNLREYKTEGFFFFFSRQVLDFFWVPGSMLSCFSDFLLFCFSAFLLLCFLLSLLLCFSCFSAFLLFAFPASLLFCFSVFPASLLLYFCAFLLLLFYLFFSSVMCFAALLPAPLLLCFLFLLSRCFSFSFALFWSVYILNETLQRP